MCGEPVHLGNDTDFLWCLGCVDSVESHLVTGQADPEKEDSDGKDNNKDDDEG